MRTDLTGIYLHKIKEIFKESAQVKEAIKETSSDLILHMATIIADAFHKRQRLFLFGNGGSAADAQHIAAEFVNRFQMERPPLPAIALTVDTSALTAISNDFHFDDIFLKQLQALAQLDDVALGISTSGRSPNVLKALKWARSNRGLTLSFAGITETEMDNFSDVILHVPSKVTARIQECHITVAHIICALVDEMLFGLPEEFS